MQLYHSLRVSFFLTPCSYAFPVSDRTEEAHPWQNSNPILELGGAHPGYLPAANALDLQTDSALSHGALAYDPSSYHAAPVVGVPSADGSFANHQNVPDQIWSHDNDTDRPLVAGPLLAFVAAAPADHDNFNTATNGSDLGVLHALDFGELLQLGFQSPTSVSEVVVQAPNPTTTGQNSTGDTVVMQRDGGLFFCSQIGCDATYPRKGDCRRHLKKHNGPVLDCLQRGCAMKFYRHDKLRAHMQQGHGITVAAPRRGRRNAH